MNLLILLVSMDLIKPRIGTLNKSVLNLKNMLNDYKPINEKDPFLTKMKPFFEQR
jgi:hypothetical protein